MPQKSQYLFIKYLQGLEALKAEPEHSFDFEKSLRAHPVLKSLVESSPSLSFILDYRTGKYYHFSSNALQVSGQKKESFLTEGIALAIDIHNKEDGRIYYNSIFEKRLKFMQSLKPDDHSFYFYQHNFRLISKDKKQKTLLQEYQVVKADAKGNPLVIMGFCTDISHIKTDTRITDAVILRKPGEMPVPVEITYYYPRAEEGLLTNKELEILKWILEGLNSKEIADKLHISTHTVRTHRKHMHEKTNAKNIADLLRHALGNGLI